MCKPAASLFFACLLTCVAHAQTSQSTLQGVVRDPTGANVPEASVTVSNLSTGVANRTKTSTEGRFVMPYLLPGDYTISVEKSVSAPREAHSPVANREKK